MVREVKRDLVRESKGDRPTVMAEHLRERDEAEARYFGDHRELDHPSVLDVGVGESNAPETHAFLEKLSPDVVLLFGTSIIEPPILSDYEGRILNMHLGLSPYYRGAATNFWPLVRGEPECVGVTVHHAILKVDAGAILHQVRPELAPDDGPHDVGCKAIVAGARAVVSTLERFRQAPSQGAPQERGRGLLFRRRDFSAEAVEQMRANFRAGMLPRYLASKAERDAAHPLVELA